jgi:hypothetical protein
MPSKSDTNELPFSFTSKIERVTIELKPEKAAKAQPNRTAA